MAHPLMDMILLIIQAAHVDNLPWKQVLYTFLCNYHATPHCSTKSHLLKFCLEGLYALSFQSFIQNNQAVMTLRHADAAAKIKIKWHADMKYRAKPSNLKVDDIVLCQQQKNGKLCSAFEPQLYKVISVKRPMITTLSGTRKITRNLSHFKVLCSSKKSHRKKRRRK